MRFTSIFHRIGTARRRVWQWVPAVAVLMGSLVQPALGQYNASSAKSILSQSDGGFCDQQHGADNAFYKTGCCGAPGERECGFVLHFGKGPWGDSPGCTDPDSNILRWSSYDSNLFCQLNTPLPVLPFLLTPNKPAIRDFQFFVTSDLHFYRVSYNLNDQVNHPSRINAMNAAATLAGHPYTAVVVPGDILTGGGEERLGAYRTLWEQNTLPGASINLPVLFGLGNHDASAQTGFFGPDTTDDAQRLWEYLDARMRLQHMDTSINGCLPGIDFGCFGFGSLAGSHNYSWDWQGVHMVMLNTWAGDTDRKYPPPLGMNGLAWLTRDLAYYVGNSRRPVILFQHYRLDDVGSNEWSTQNLSDFVNVIKSYNVVGLFSGHSHALEFSSRASVVNQPLAGTGAGPGTRLDNFVDGAGGDCHGDGQHLCSNAIANFLTVHVSDHYLDVTADSWQGTAPTYADDTIGFRTRVDSSGHSSSGFCRKRMAATYNEVTNLVTVQIENSAHTITVTNNQSVALTGALAIQVSDSGGAGLANWDFVDSCDSSSGKPYVVLTEGSLAPGNPLTVAFSANAGLTSSQIKVFQLTDSLVSSDNSPVVGLSDVTLQVTSASGNPVSFTYSIDPYTSGDTTQWLHVTSNSSTTPATFTLRADNLPSYAHQFASFTVTPGDATVAPLTVTVTLAPAAFTVSSNVSNSQILFDDVPSGVPYSAVVTPNSVHKLNVTDPQFPSAGIKYVFNHWSIGPGRNPPLTVPFGGLDAAVYFDTSYQVNQAITPAGGGTVTNSSHPNGGYYPAGDTHFKASPNPGYYFVGYSGGLTGALPDADIDLRSPLTFTATFAANPSVTVTTNVAAAEGSTVKINGVPAAPPDSVQFAPNTAVTISAPASFVSATDPRIRYIFQQWSDGETLVQRSFTLGVSNATFTAQYKSQFQVSVSVSSAVAGSATGGGWYDSGAAVTIQATPAAGFKFLGIGGDLASAANPFVFNAAGPENLLATFGPNGTPQIYVVSGAATDTTVVQGSQTLPARALSLSLRNLGPGGALHAEIDSVAAIQVISGSGAVTAALTSPVVVGDLIAGASAGATVNFLWPASATRVRMTVNFSANGGAYRGSTVLNLFR